MRKFVFATVLLAGCVAVTAGQAQSQSAGYIGQVIMTAGSYCPAGWHAADGSLMPINQNQALYYVIRNTYGGDGKTTFALPNLKDVKLGNEPFTWCIGVTGIFPTPDR
jgi:Phage Tail Collar Domain